MRSRSFVLVALALLALLGGAGALLAYDSSQSQTIAKGIAVAGVDVGGTSGAQARARLRVALQARLQRPVILRFAARRFVLPPSASRTAIDIPGSVREALARSRSASIFTRVWRSLTGGRVAARIEPAVSFSPPAVKRLVDRVAATLDHPARDASISFASGTVSRVPGSSGLQVRTAALSAAIGQALTHPRAAHDLRIPVLRIQPRVSDSQLAAEYPTVITIDRSAFTLRLWRHLHLTKSYTIAVGRAGLETPAGLYHIQDREVDPSWHVPNSAWAGALAGQTIPPGPQDPIKARWLGIYNGAGIHGTDVLSSLGSAASHGCIRMAIPDVIELYDQTSLGTPVYIA